MLDEVPDLRVFKPKFEKIRKKKVTFRDSSVEHRENRQENEYYLLCHGDLNIKNIMFKENIFDGGLYAYRFSLVKQYFTILSETLKKMNFQDEIPLFAEFEKQFFRHRNMGTLGFLLVLIKTY